MELLLNSVWSLITIAFLRDLLRIGRGEQVNRRAPITSLVLAAAILFPVISISDDIWSKQNPTDISDHQRRDLHASSSHFLTPMAAAIPEPTVAERNYCFQRLAVQWKSPSPKTEDTSFASIQSRPPPTA